MKGYDHTKAGKKNKLKIGQKVRAKSSLVDWHASHLYWSYARTTDKKEYSANEKEIDAEDLPHLYAWTWAKLGNKRPTGVINRYGSQDNDEGVDRNNIHVTFNFNTELGSIEIDGYWDEDSVDLVRKRKKK